MGTEQPATRRGVPSKREPARPPPLERRLRQHAAGLLLALILAGALAVHHTGVGIGDMHHDGMSAAIEMCIGVISAVGASVAAVALGVLALGRWATPAELVPASALTVAGTCSHEARAGPPPPSLLCVWRR